VKKKVTLKRKKMNNFNSMDISLDNDQLFDLREVSLTNLIDLDISGILNDLNETSNQASLAPTSVLIGTNENSEFEYERVMADQGDRLSPNNQSVDFEAFTILQNENPNPKQDHVNHDSIFTHMLRMTEYSNEVHPVSSEAKNEFQRHIIDNGSHNIYNQNVRFFSFFFSFYF
jgi:hypothetical protein